jgi:hypothetical protein
MEELMKFSNWLSTSQLIPRALQKKPADIALVLMRGRDLGISSLQALSCINVIEGKTVLAAELLLALCVREKGVCEYFRLLESTPQKATCEAKRSGCEAVRLSYTIQEAQGAGLAGKDNWKRHPATMLRWRCIGALAKTVFPDLAMGLYTPDEAEEIAANAAQTTAPSEPAVPSGWKNPWVEQEAKTETVSQPTTKTSRLREKLKAKVVDVKQGQTEDEAEVKHNEAIYQRNAEMFLSEDEIPPPTDADAPVPF